MHLDLSEEETVALLNLSTETIEKDRFPPAPRVQTLRSFLAIRADGSRGAAAGQTAHPGGARSQPAAPV